MKEKVNKGLKNKISVIQAILTVLYVACICNNDNILLDNTTIKVKNINTVIG